MVTSVKKEVIASLAEGSSVAQFYTIGERAFTTESTKVDLATKCYNACPEFYMVTPSKLPVMMYQGLKSGVVDAYSKGDEGKANEAFLAKVDLNWNYVTKPVFEKHSGHKVHASNNWLATTDFKALKRGDLDFGKDDGKAIAGMLQARKDKVVGQVNTVIKRLQDTAKKLFDTTESEPPVKTFDLVKDLEKILTKSEKFDDENPVLLKKLFDDVIAKYSKA